MAQTLVNQGHVSLGTIQPFLQISFNLVLSGSDEFSPPFRASQVVSLIWLLEDNKPGFNEYCYVYSQTSLQDSINLPALAPDQSDVAPHQPVIAPNPPAFALVQPAVASCQPAA